MARFYQGRFTPRHPEKYRGNTENIIYRSSWEFTFLTWLDQNPNVFWYASEELCLPYYFQGDSKWHRYYPDFIVELQTKTETRQIWMVEIKPYRQTLAPGRKRFTNPRTQLKETLNYAKNQAKWQAAQAFCSNKGWKFVVITEKTLYPSRSIR